ncbi:MAG TPA: sialidase family protein [Kofleriaceae bacterium]|nr:sialidase family protein [Kofleriaceae bacterium]
MRRAAGVLLAALAGAGCAGGDAIAPAPTVEDTVQVVPGAGLPPEYGAVAGPSNNNLDVVRHDGRVYLATRNAPDHFASPDAKLFVFSSPSPSPSPSDDEQSWQFEALFTTGANDLREPRLLSFKGRLFLYWAQLAAGTGVFDPLGMSVSERTAPGTWTAPADLYRPGEKYIPWRAQVHDGRAYLTVYRNGQRIYDFSGLPMDVELLVSDDGLDWHPVDPARPVVSTGGGSETAFAFDPAGDLYAVIRNERGDEAFGWGSKICRARKGDLSAWTCKPDPKKYDSPALFAHDGRIFLVGRRHVSDTGNFSQDLTEPWSLPSTINNLIAYSAKPKRCALWQVDRATLTVRHLTDVPGWGDTCFPSLIDDPADARRRILYNYSSPLDGPDLAWIDGQRGETRIYRTPFRFK